jgi:sugar lactone lactonase YvrE
MRFDPSGKVVTSFGTGMIVQAHGMTIDRDGNVWVTDAQIKDGKGNQVLKFSPMEAADGARQSRRRGQRDRCIQRALRRRHRSQRRHLRRRWSHRRHPGQPHHEVLEGRQVHQGVGQARNGSGEFDTPHSIAIDSRGRIFVADRSNSRVQIFDQDGKFLDQWKQFGRPSGIYIDRNDTMIVADSQSNSKQNPGYRRGIYVGSARDGKVTALIPFVEPDPEKNNNAGVEGVAIDAKGNVYGAEVSTERLKKYAKASSTN